MSDTKHYNDMLNMQRPVSKHHIPMNILDRAAQFAPFSALPYYNTVVKEKSRYTENFCELCDEEKEIINSSLNDIINNFYSIKNIFIEYFIKDEKKHGGRYETKIQSIKKIDIYNKILILKDDTKIDFSNIVKLYPVKDTEE